MRTIAPEEARLVIDSGDSPREVLLSSYLDPAAIELAETEANRWIKHLRHLRVDDVPLRDRFTHRGDSLWWFIELFLHKERAVVHVFRAIHAVERLMQIERPTGMRVIAAGLVARVIAPQVAARGGVRVEVPPARALWPGRDWSRLRPAFYIVTAWINALRHRWRSPTKISRTHTVGFVHSAFWRSDTNAEAYIGEVIRELTTRLDASMPLVLVGVGPRTMLKGRGWRQRLGEFSGTGSRVPFCRIEELSANARGPTPWSTWRQCRQDERALRDSNELRRAARVRGCDAWPILRRELSGVAFLQLPWSRVAMDQAAAALDTLQPTVVFTYAEAGGWGRALVLECRRRKIASVGLQHGFIYRHWLNYLHDLDETHPSRSNPDDRGFPRPDLTLVFDRLAERQLREAGRFPADAIRVTGSARLDALVTAFRAITEDDRRRVREALGAAANDRVVLVASKFSQIQLVLASLVEWTARHPDLRLVIKTHPAESPDPYRRMTMGAANATIAPASADLAALLAVTSLLVTVNSTAAFEAMVLDVPTLVLALPNNLSPFVEAGAMSGAERPEAIGPALEALLYDEERRRQLAGVRRAFLDQSGLTSDGRAAARSAEAIRQLARTGIGGQGSGIPTTIPR
ncbi:MAG: hypothetical protein HYZ58_07615 [Acidobacteria bacterium]|nr:hypothetical protein [Acidobacteriota bacterium]